MDDFSTPSSVGNSRLKWFIVDILHYDIESLDSLVSHLNLRGSIGWRDSWAHDFSIDEVFPVIEVLIEDRIVEALAFSERTRMLELANIPISALRGDRDAFWFRLTEKGKMIWEDWRRRYMR